MSDREKVIERLGKVSYYFKSLRAVGWQGDADIYREHQESVNMAIALLKEQENLTANTPSTTVLDVLDMPDVRRTMSRSTFANSAVSTQATDTRR